MSIPSLMNETGHSKPVHWDNPGAGDGEGSGRGVWEGDICIPVAGSCQRMAKTSTIL